MKQILILTAILFSSAICKAQDDNKEDSLLIISFQQQLKNSTGTAEVDLLNDIAWQYMWYGNNDKKSSFDYASEAKKKAESINYEKGIGYASLMMGMYYNKSNKSLADSLFKTAFNIAQKINESRLLGWYYYQSWELKKAIVYFREAKDIDGEAEAATWLCEEYSYRNEAETDFSYCQRALELAEVKKQRRLTYNKWMTGFAFTTLAGLYTYVGDYESALTFTNKAKKFSSPRDLYWTYASTYQQMGKYDSSVFYYEKALVGAKNRWHIMRYAGYANQRVGNYKRAIELLEESSNMFQKAEAEKKGFPFNWRGEIHSNLGEAYDSLRNRKKAVQNYKFALEHSRKSYQLLQVTPKPGGKFYGYDRDRKNWIMNVSRELSTIFAGLNKYDSALYYYRQYAQMKDTLNNKKRAWQLNMQLSNLKKAAEDQKRTSQLQLLQKDNQLKQSKLKQETFVKNSLALGLILLLLIGVFTFRTLHFKRKAERLRSIQLENELKVQDLESKQKHTELQHRATELEMQALRAQMNPHFIFNCLSSINRFILKNETEAASDYLTRFSRLIRMVLINSQKPTIPLEDEMEMLGLYLDMERLRFKNSFGYTITYDNITQSDSILIPPLLLQPFCENAIWHGLMHLANCTEGKERRAQLKILISKESGVLKCTISDNGIGRKKAAEIKSKSAEREKSLGLKITTDRLALLNKKEDIETYFEMQDLYDEDGNAAGTKVIIKIGCQETVAYLD
jgi:hypothetical protein